MQLNLDGDAHVVEVVIGGRVYLATRRQFEEFTDLSAMLETVVRAGAQPSDIRHIFDESTSTDAVGERFVKWQGAKNRKLFVVASSTQKH